MVTRLFNLYLRINRSNKSVQLGFPVIDKTVDLVHNYIYPSIHDKRI